MENKIKEYVNKLVQEAFDKLHVINDSKILISIAGNGSEDVTCIVLMKTTQEQVYPYIGKKLALEFKSKFGYDIRFFTFSIYDQAYRESVLTRSIKNNGKYNIVIGNDSKQYDVPIDTNHTVGFIKSRYLGNITINLFPNIKSENPYSNSMYPGYNNLNNPRILLMDLVKLKRDRGDFPSVSYLGYKGWESFIQDYMAVCNGMRPDHGFKYRVICDQIHGYNPWL